jgi:hypothetical protein
MLGAMWVSHSVLSATQAATQTATQAADAALAKHVKDNHHHSDSRRD